jgi:hypothetical protein
MAARAESAAGARGRARARAEQGNASSVSKFSP